MRNAESKTLKSEAPTRIKELQEKIKDENYINEAVERIALIMSKQIIESRMVKKI